MDTQNSPVKNQASPENGRQDRPDNRRRRPRRRGNAPSGQQNAVKPVSASASQETNPAKADPESQKNNRPPRQDFRQKQNRPQETRKEGRRLDSRENQQKDRPRNAAPKPETMYQPDWGTPPDPSEAASSLRKKPVDQPLSGRSFTRRG